jgi:hypothetical protein
VRSNLNTQGIGMGLYISRNIVHAFGGKVYVDSELGRGSTFGFVIQLSPNVNNNQVNDRVLNDRVPRRTNILRIPRLVWNQQLEEENSISSSDTEIMGSMNNSDSLNISLGSLIKS